MLTAAVQVAGALMRLCSRRCEVVYGIVAGDALSIYHREELVVLFSESTVL